MPGHNEEQEIIRMDKTHIHYHFKSCLNFRKANRSPPALLRRHILLVGDDVQFQMSLNRILETGKYVFHPCSLKKNLTLSAMQDFSVILLDLPHANATIQERIMELQRRFAIIPIIILDRTGRDPPVDNLLPDGIFSHLAFPCSRASLLHDIDLAIKFSRTLRENMCLRQSFGIPTQEAGFYDSPFISEMQRRQIMMYAKTECHVLTVGERGTEKNLVAQQIHGNSSRKHKPLIVVHCHKLMPRVFDAVLFGGLQNTSLSTSMSRIGLLELARGGTICFDRISEMPLPIQEKLCRLLRKEKQQQGASGDCLPLNFRMVAGTRIDLDEACMSGKFLKELLNHFCSIMIPLPPLREIQSEIPSLANSLAEEFSQQNRTECQQFSDAAMSKLQHYAWPGNNRELRNVIHWACANTNGYIIPEHNIVFSRIDKDCGVIGLAGLTMAEVERRLLIETLAACGGNRAESARRLGVSEKTIYNKFKQYHLKGV